MTETERKALALVNEVSDGFHDVTSLYAIHTAKALRSALCRAIEQHEAFRQEVSDAIEALKKDVGTGWDHCRPAYACNRFIIAKPDPLVEAFGHDLATDIRAAIEKRGGKIVWGEG